MMEAFLAHLLSPEITALVGGRVNWRVQPPDQTARPYVNLQLVGGRRDYSLDGPRRWRGSRVQVDVWAEGGASANDVWAAVEARLSGFAGTLFGVEFSMIRLEGLRSLSDRLEDGTLLAGRSGDFSFRWRDAT
ncbi:DUF3168 domain-containing protein [Celeribacter naphthalenivorans]|uniref:DUF3168 domain-containing protein n=1 Tax=Celeribacter naphthalenivorans TaxID=1614694 RepID=UPI001CF9E26A|nr:DUF3168 domain-containing protein [Celeribacter naphthalenivorans]